MRPLLLTAISLSLFGAATGADRPKVIFLLAEDPGETTNRAAEKPDLVEWLTTLHRGHLQP